MRDLVSGWAEKNGIALLWPEQFGSLKNEKRFAGSEDFQSNVCIDYGKFIERIPFFLLRPANLDQLASCATFLNEQLIPYKVRGAAHSSGGQVLTDQGAVIELSGLAGILEDYPDKEEIVVEGGMWWLHLAEYLHTQGRRPVVLTDNFRTTVAGTLAVGGFGDTTHLYGLQIQSVSNLTLVTADGQIRRLEASDKLFWYVLAGRGQLGIIANARLKTIRRTSKLCVRMMKWQSVQHYIEDAIGIIENGIYEFFRTRIRFEPELTKRNQVVGVAGNFRNDIPEDDTQTRFLKHAKLYPHQQIDFFRNRTHDSLGIWKLCSPSVEMIFPLPDGIKTWQEINRQILESGLFQYLARGSSIMVLRNDHKFPLAPLPDSDFCMMIALRPAMPHTMVNQYLPLLHNFEEQALRAGAKIYLMSIEPEVPNFLEMQFGSALQEFTALKNELDPNRLLNPGLLP